MTKSLVTGPGTASCPPGVGAPAAGSDDCPLPLPATNCKQRIIELVVLGGKGQGLFKKAMQDFLGVTRNIQLRLHVQLQRSRHYGAKSLILVA